MEEKRQRSMEWRCSECLLNSVRVFERCCLLSEHRNASLQNNTSVSQLHKTNNAFIEPSTTLTSWQTQRLHLLVHVQVLLHHGERLPLLQRLVLLRALHIASADVLQRGARWQRRLLPITAIPLAHIQHGDGRLEDLRVVHDAYRSRHSRAPYTDAPPGPFA